MLKTVNLHSSVLCKFVQLWSVFIQGVEVPLLQLQHFIILVVYDFFFTDCVIRSSSVCLNFFQGRALVENI